MWYKTGTINLIANNATVTGTGTAWADAKFGVMPGMILLAPDNKLYEVKQVNSNTSLTLNSNYSGSKASGQSYAIITTYEGDISQFSARFAAMLTFFQGSRNDTVSWFTGSGDMTFTKDDGIKLTVPTLAKMQADNAATITTGLANSYTKNQVNLLNYSPTTAVSNAVWRKVGRITNMGQGGQTIVITIGGMASYNGHPNANGLTQIVIRTGSGSVTTVNSLGRASVSAYVTNSPGSVTSTQLISDLGLIETSSNTFELYLKYNPFVSGISASISATSVYHIVNNWVWDNTIVTDPAIILEREIIKVWTEGSLPNPVSAGEFGIGGVTPLLNPATVMEVIKTKPTGKYAVNSGSADMPRGDVAYYLDWSMTATSSGGHGFLLASALADKGSVQEGLYKNTLRNGNWQGWLKIAIDNSMAQVIAPTMKSWGGTAGYVKLAEYGPTATGASGILFSVSNGQGYGTPGIDHKLVYFSTRGASSTALTPRGLQVLSFGLNYVENVNLVFGTLYNSTTGKWELWMKGPGYNVPSIQILGNVSGTAILAGITYNSESSWQTAMPSGLTFVTETKALSGFNTTVDSNGFIKAASPIVKLFGDGVSELNDESLGVTTERVSQGVYRVSSVRGFNADGVWGGAGNGIEIPVDDNKRPLVWVESKVLSDGDIEIRTYHRTYDTGPYSTRNIEAMDSGEVDKKKQPIYVEMPDGTPIDIPDGRFIDLRVEMPAVKEPEPVF
ncbi:Uncharacterised protein [Serratia fonticola]|uniref:phage tail fiber protein n=1 Tax=Serratia fonticola TaxID=47917 RepID=UPI002183B4EF|nr:hypothetical protein [Serratia fonticola]CAI2104397.1 Uncharacterised protein [Serratia fonticola]